MSIPTLKTERLIIREYTPHDLQARHRLVVEAFGSDGSLDDTQEWLTWTIANYRELAKLYQPPYGDYAIVLKKSQQVIGSVGLVQTIVPWGVFDDSPHTLTTPEFGLFWGILPEHWGKGYAGEAAHAFIEQVFKQLQAKRVVATTEDDNHNSLRVMHKLGMTIHRNPGDEPFWFEVVGKLDNFQAK